MAVIQKGTVENYLQSGVGWSPKAGRFEEARLQIRYADLAAWETTLQNLGYEYRYDPIGTSPAGLLSYRRPQETQPPDEALSDTWSVRYKEEQRDIWQDDLVAEQLARLADATTRARFKADIESMLKGETERAAVYDSDGVVTAASYALTISSIIAKARMAPNGQPDPEFTAMATALANDLANGVTAQFVSTPALVRTTLMPVDTTLQPAFSYVNNLFTTASLLAYETTLPTNLSSAINADFPTYWWLSKAPTCEQQDDGRWRYQREYWGVPRVAFLLADRITTPT